MKRWISLFAMLLMVLILTVPAAAAEDSTAATMRLESTQGTVTVKNASGLAVKQQNKMRLYDGYTIKTEASSYAYISLDGSKTLKLDASSEASVSKNGKKLEVSLVSGSLFFNVEKPLGSNESMGIRTSTMVTGIRGTAGLVTTPDRNHTEITLLTGRMEVTGRDSHSGQMQTVLMTAGEHVIVKQEREGTPEEHLEIQKVSAKERELPGFVAEEVAEDPDLQNKISEETNLSVPLIIGDVESRLAADEAAAAEKGEQVQKQLEQQKKEMQQEQDEVVDPVFEAVEAPEGNNGNGSSSTPVNPTPAPDTTQTLTNPTEQELREALASDVVEISINDAALELTSALTVPADKTLNLNSGTLTNAQDLTVGGTMNVASGMVVTNDGTLTVTSTNSIHVSGTLVNNGALVIGTANEAGLADIPGTLNSAKGTITVANGSTFTATGTIVTADQSRSILVMSGGKINISHKPDMQVFAEGNQLVAQSGTYSYTNHGASNIYVDILIYVEPATYTVTLPTGTGYTTRMMSNSSTVSEGGEFRFIIELDAAHSNSRPTVSANGTQLTAVDGVYTISNITADQTVTITGVTLNSYTVSWMNGDTLIDTTMVEHGTVPSHADVKMEPTVEYTYTFDGWAISQIDPALADLPAVVADMTYYAVFTPEARTYTVTVPSDEGYDVAYIFEVETELTGIEPYSEFRFFVELTEEYSGSFDTLVVSANGVELEPIDGPLYIVESVTEDITITVTGYHQTAFSVTLPTSDAYSVNYYDIEFPNDMNPKVLAAGEQVGVGLEFPDGISVDAVDLTATTVDGDPVEVTASQDIVGEFSFTMPESDVILAVTNASYSLKSTNGATVQTLLDDSATVGVKVSGWETMADHPNDIGTDTLLTVNKGQTLDLWTDATFLGGLTNNGTVTADYRYLTFSDGAALTNHGTFNGYSLTSSGPITNDGTFNGYSLTSYSPVTNDGPMEISSQLYVYSTMENRSTINTQSVYVREGGELTNSGTITVTGSNAVTLTGGTLTNTGKLNTRFISMDSASTLNQNGGTMNITPDYTDYLDYCIITYGGAINIAGGEINCPDTCTAIYIPQASINLSMTGGTINAKTAIYDGTNSKINLTGGSINTTDSAFSIVSGTELVIDGADVTMAADTVLFRGSDLNVALKNGSITLAVTGTNDDGLPESGTLCGFKMLTLNWTGGTIKVPEVSALFDQEPAILVNGTDRLTRDNLEELCDAVTETPDPGSSAYAMNIYSIR